MGLSLPEISLQNPIHTRNKIYMSQVNESVCESLSGYENCLSIDICKVVRVSDGFRESKNNHNFPKISH